MIKRWSLLFICSLYLILTHASDGCFKTTFNPSHTLSPMTTISSNRNFIPTPEQIEREHKKISFYLETYFEYQLRRTQGKQAIENPEYVQDKLQEVYFDLCHFIWNAFDRNPAWITNPEAIPVFEYMKPFATETKKKVIGNKRFCQHAAMSMRTYEEINGKRYFQKPKSLNGWIGRIGTMRFYLTKLTELERSDRGL